MPSQQEQVFFYRFRSPQNVFLLRRNTGAFKPICETFGFISDSLSPPIPGRVGFIGRKTGGEEEEEATNLDTFLSCVCA